jgi:hypothetical protein
MSLDKYNSTGSRLKTAWVRDATRGHLASPGERIHHLITIDDDDTRTENTHKPAYI